MRYLFLTILIWGFAYNFSGNIAAVVDNDFVALSRAFFGALIFLPFVKIVGLRKEFIAGLMCIGALQFSIQLSLYYRAFQYISVAEVLLFLAILPIYIAIIDDLVKRVIKPISFLSAIIATVATIFIRWSEISNDFFIGMVLVQLMCLTFSMGVVWYKYHNINYNSDNIPDHNLFFYVMLGGVVSSSIIFLLFGNFEELPTTPGHYGMLAYLGIVVTGICYALLNKGAKMVSGATTGIFHNLSIPVGMLITFLFFDSGSIDPITATITLIIMGIALYINEVYSDRFVINLSKKLASVDS